jgi:hypothetical protein
MLFPAGHHQQHGDQHHTTRSSAAGDERILLRSSRNSRPTGELLLPRLVDQRIHMVDLAADILLYS